jgi:hypothetical protein
LRLPRDRSNDFAKKLGIETMAHTNASAANLDE